MLVEDVERCLFLRKCLNEKVVLGSWCILMRFFLEPLPLEPRGCYVLKYSCVLYCFIPRIRHRLRSLFPLTMSASRGVNAHYGQLARSQHPYKQCSSLSKRTVIALTAPMTSLNAARTHSVNNCPTCVLNHSKATANAFNSSAFQSSCIDVVFTYKTRISCRCSSSSDSAFCSLILFLQARKQFGFGEG